MLNLYKIEGDSMRFTKLFFAMFFAALVVGEFNYLMATKGTSCSEGDEDPEQAMPQISKVILDAVNEFIEQNINSERCCCVNIKVSPERSELMSLNDPPWRVSELTPDRLGQMSMYVMKKIEEAGLVEQLAEQAIPQLIKEDPRLKGLIVELQGDQLIFKRTFLSRYSFLRSKVIFAFLVLVSAIVLLTYLEIRGADLLRILEMEPRFVTESENTNNHFDLHII